MIGSFLKEYATAIGAMPFNLKTFSYVSEPKLIEDIKGEIKATIRGEKSGVRILWGIPGSGKTTTTKAVMNELLEEKAIAGCIYIAPNENSKVGHAEIFRRYIADWRGQLLRFWRGQLKPWDYRWTRDEISTWLRHYKETHEGDKEIFALLNEDTDSYKQFMEVACHAGTPGFLVNGIDKLKAFNFPILEADSDKSSTMWELGTKTLWSLFEGKAPKG